MRAILFDLDGTLLDLDTAAFMRRYFQAIRRIETPGWDGNLLDAVAIGTEEMLGRHPGRTNADVFWQRFEDITGRPQHEWLPVFEEFYRSGFPGLREGAGPNEDHRLAWAGLSELPDDVLVTSYETSTACKPWPEYFSEVARRIGVPPSDCLMVGDDPSMDLGSRDAGMKAWLLDEARAGWAADYVGSLDELADFIERC
jgi:FMN phosphatase YigB (HAD superfamily)